MLSCEFLFISYLLILLSFFRLFSGKANTVPHPDGAWDSFIQAVTSANAAIGTVWDPIKRVDHPWIRVEKLTKAYHPELVKRKCVIS